jgi:cation diffusion facilitator family transporter
MDAQMVESLRHEHVFLGVDHERNERKTWIVILVCGAMMVLEIGGGALFHSMALIADGLHMSTHAGALVIAALAYTYARRHARDARFSFGTGKLGDLAAFTSAIALAMIAALIGFESVQRLLHPLSIAFNEAIPVAVLGLGVNLLSAWLLKDDHDHLPGHDHGHDHGYGHDHANGHDHHHDDHHHDAHHHDAHHHDAHDQHRPDHARDLNLRAAYVHVIADAAVSVLAIVGLVAGRQLGWVWMDPVMGIVGACVIANWSWGLIRAAGGVLLDMQPDAGLTAEIEHRLNVGEDHVTDLHVWRVGPGHHAAVVAIATRQPQRPDAYKDRLSGLTGLSHVTVEVQPQAA